MEAIMSDDKETLPLSVATAWQNAVRSQVLLTSPPLGAVKPRSIVIDAMLRMAGTRHD
jgi:hypothetical protein